MRRSTTSTQLTHVHTHTRNARTHSKKKKKAKRKKKRKRKKKGNSSSIHTFLLYGSPMSSFPPEEKRKEKPGPPAIFTHSCLCREGMGWGKQGGCWMGPETVVPGRCIMFTHTQAKKGKATTHTHIHTDTQT
eukprot:TRINITY_DN4663_c5_g1_i1.p2 TRINITY_DN4663_c5_g1~~TRINITY_DN4663_c5_g1_i1.p2  ORF type:complete len:132 (+),score=8.08 TRINITY_DN4663_c5_g1_i1:386-781(+)